MKAWTIATAVAVGIAAVYVLSPLTVWFVVAMWALHRYATSGLEVDEGRWMTALLVAAIALRIIPIAILFATTDHARVPFGVFFGDEEFYLRRSIWLRNVALGITIHPADLIYAFDESGWTSHLYVLSFLEAFVGPAPYGLHLSGVALYLLAAVVLFRMLRPSFGRAPAFLLFALLCFLPSLFVWSVSVLKEPLYVLLTIVSLAMAAAVVRAKRWIGRIAALVTLIAVVATIGTVRDGAMFLVAGGIALGWAATWIVRRPKVVVAVVIATPILLGAAFRDPRVQNRAYHALQVAARTHWGHVRTPGWTYQLLDQHYYDDVFSIDGLEARDAALYVVGALERYVTVPLPWEAQSTAALAYIPEQLVWYLIVLLLPAGLVFALRRDALLTCLLLGVGIAGALAIALFSGNVGTLVRLRVLALPYFAAISAVGACELLALARRRADGPLVEKAASYATS